MRLDPLLVTVFCLVACAIVFAWGLLMLIRPERFGELARVDWNADVVDATDRRRRVTVRLSGLVFALVSAAFIVLMVVSLMR